jgi:hypothetical protein
LRIIRFIDGTLYLMRKDFPSLPHLPSGATGRDTRYDPSLRVFLIERFYRNHQSLKQVFNFFGVAAWLP